MADGRMLKKVICESGRLAALKNDSHRLIYTWLIPHLDVEGRHSADPRIIKGHVAPILNHITHKVIDAALRDMEVNDLIVLYDINGNKYLELKRFKKHQNLREDRERKSDIPGPVPDGSRITPGPVPEDSRRTPTQVNLSEVKLKEAKARAEHLPVDNSKQEKPKQPLSENQKPKPGNVHGERWNGKGEELDVIMQDIANRYGFAYHGKVLAFVRANLNRCNPDAMIRCLQRLISDRLAGKAIPLPDRWLDAALNGTKDGVAGENQRAEAEEFDREQQAVKEPPTQRGMATMKQILAGVVGATS